MARRGARRAIDLAVFIDTLVRVAGAIGLDTLAFVVWNVGTRPPLAAWREVRRAVATRRGLLAGCVAAVVGAIFVVAASVLLLPAVANPPRDLAFVELFAFLVALALEHIVGDDLRALGGMRVS
ncbi:MAG: hypothetical protein NVSMB19_11300 [Vulcanimicrobiaceae bacterium]